MKRPGFLTFAEIGLGVANVDGISKLELAMHHDRAESMFNFGYRKTSLEIVDKLTVKTNQLKSKVEERRSRIVALKKEHKITDAIYIDLLEQARDAMKKNDQRMSYSVSNKIERGGIKEEEFVIGAGVVMNLLTESDMARNEEALVTRFELIIRNLEDLPNDEGKLTGHRLSESELTYLGF